MRGKYINETSEFAVTNNWGKRVKAKKSEEVFTFSYYILYYKNLLAIDKYSTEKRVMYTDRNLFLLYEPPFTQEPKSSIFRF